MTADKTIYLRPTEWIDSDHPAVRARAAELLAADGADVETARAAFEFVRDEIPHSWDIQSRRVARRASEVLEYRTGICYAKSHLLAALLRASGLPSGLSYQKLTLGETPKTGYAVHALNTVFLPSIGRWIRLDARGNKPGVDAQFSLDEERLAFCVRPLFGERDFGGNFADPPLCITETLRRHDDCLLMYAHGLPTELKP